MPTSQLSPAVAIQISATHHPNGCQVCYEPSGGSGELFSKLGTA